jgi:glutathione peroxidase
MTAARFSRTALLRRLALLSALAGSAAVALALSAPPADKPAADAPAAPKQEDPRHVLKFTVDSITGQPVNLADYHGKVVLIVNTASKCGFTPQYTALEQVYKDLQSKGFVVLGFPSNDFGRQEPGTNEEIAEFCGTRFGVTFPMFAKIPVTGENAHPLYKALAAQPAPIGGAPKWNFTKFLVDRNGNVVERFEPTVKPDSPALLAKVNALLAAEPAGK